MPTTPITAADLRPLDFLLYRPTGVFGRLIKFKTGHNISHVEVFLGRDPLRYVDRALLGALDAAHGLGQQYATASRDGLGVNFYPVRLDASLAYVMRPVLEPSTASLALATARALGMRGTPYGWLDLLDFYGLGINGPGVVCSPYATLIGRAAGLDLFNGMQPRLVAPYLFRASEHLHPVWTDGQDAALDAAGV